MSAKERLTEAAYDLFDERGYDQVTVDQIAERAGVGRTTFFRLFGSKEDVIFPDHDRVLGLVSGRLASASRATVAVAVTEAARLVLREYVGEGARARTRYRLTSTVPALRDRELAGTRQYVSVFREAVHGWLGGTSETRLRAELLAGAVVTAHNHVLRSWLRGETEDPEPAFDAAMSDVVALFDPRPSGGEASLVVLHTTKDLDEILPQLRAFAGE